MTKQEILSRLLSNISDEYDKAVGSFFYDAEYPIAIELESVHAELARILKNALAKRRAARSSTIRSPSRG